MVTVLLLGIIYLAFISLGLPDSILGVAIPAIHQEWGIPLSSFGLVSTIGIIGTIISSLTSAYVIEKVGTGKIVFLSCLVTGASLLGISYIPSFYWMLLFVLPLGLGGGAVDTALNNYVALHFKAHHMNWLHSFWGVGATTGPLIMGAMLLGRGWQFGYRTIGFIQLSLAILLLVSLPLWSKHKPVSMHQTESTSEKKETGSVFGVPGVKMALAIMMFYCAGEIGVGLWGSTYLTRIKGYSIDSAASWMAMYYGGITIGRFLSGFISFRLNNVQMIRGGIILSLFGGILLVLPLPAIVTGFLLVLIGMGFAPIFPAMLHETPVRFGAERSQKIIGLQMGFAYIGMALVPPVFGLVFDTIDISLLPLLVSLIIFGQLISSEMLNRRVKSPSI